MTDNKLKAVGYIRVSTPVQAKEGESLKTQRQAIERVVKEKKWKLSHIYSDEGVSGAKNNRPQLIKLLQDAAKQEFQFVIIHRLSRFGRNARDLLNNLQTLKENGIKLISLKDQIDYSNPYGQAMLTMLAAVAQLERDVIDEQMRENKLARWRDGRTFLGRPPYGYRWNKESKCLEINETEADIYREIVRMYTDLSFAMMDIAIKLNERGLKAKRKPFSPMVISRILKNPSYYGNCVVNKFVYENGKRTHKEKPSSEHIAFDIPPLISKEKWDSIQKKMTFNKIKSKRGYGQSPYWLRDLLVCGECGGIVKPHPGASRKDGSFPRYYTCYWAMGSTKTRKLSKKQKCDLPYIPAGLLESEVWNGIMHPYLFGSGTFKGGTWIPSKMGELLDASRYDRTIKETTKTIESLQADLKRLKTSRERILDLIEDDRFDKNELASRLNRNREEALVIESKIKESRQRLAQAEGAKKNDDLYRRFMRDRKGALKRLAGDLFRLKPEDRKRVAEGSIVGKIRLEMGYDDETGRDVAIPKFDVSPNMALLRLLMDEGKIGKLGKDDDDRSDHHGGNDESRQNYDGTKSSHEGNIHNRNNMDNRDIHR